MTALTPGDLIAMLKTLFIVVISLFGTMVIGAAIGFVLDRAERAQVVHRLTQEDAGFRTTADGVWLWRFALDDLSDELAPPVGSAVRISAIIGMPYARLRAALPDELVLSTMADALGRRYSFSVRGWDASLDDQSTRLRRMSTSFPKAARFKLFSRIIDSGTKNGSPKALNDDINEETTTPNTPRTPFARSPTATRRADAAQVERFEELVGTALVLAFLQVTQLMPVLEIESRAAAAAVYFDGLTTPAGWGFTHTRTTFITLVSPNVLNTRNKWLRRARLWKLILSQNTEGFWDASDSVAFALEARSVQEMRNLPSTLIERAAQCVRGFFESVGQDEDLDENDVEQGVDSALDSNAGARVRENDELDAAHTVHDCPLTNTAHAILASLPSVLRRVCDELPGTSAERIWTTMCCIAVLEKQPQSWLWGDGDAHYFEERTMVDAAREWVEKQAAELPALEAAIREGKLWKRAEHITKLWYRATETRVAELRASSAIRKQMNLSHAHRSLVSIMRALLTRHETFSTFLSEPLEGLQRWQSAFCGEAAGKTSAFVAMNCCRRISLTPLLSHATPLQSLSSLSQSCACNCW